MNRNRSRARGLTPFAAAVSALVLGVSVSGLWWASSAGAGQDAKASSLAAARAIQSAAAGFRAQHVDGCPTLSSLTEERFLDRSVQQNDAWGNRFRVRCEDHALLVVSAGPDGKLDTSDDISAAR